jgi:hypothetical protein
MQDTGIGFAKYTILYKQQWKDLMESQDGSGMPLRDYSDRSVWMTWTMSYKAIKAKCEAAANLLHLWAYLDNRDVWYGLLAAARERSIVAAEYMSEWLEDIVNSVANLGLMRLSSFSATIL